MKKNYLILARRYRPQKFSDVVGQESTVTTLKNSLLLSHVAHAYLFSGSRGVGKTTLARIFAKALNCENLSQDGEPCDQCLSCQAIKEGTSLDVIEIDGASNRGIDDIRQINETVGYAPRGKYKIYIIDEVHMLTKEAFNALLKTLEEPPERVKFFFATTESHKVPSTIISRCQRFDLRRISSLLIVEKLKQITSDLSSNIDPIALEKIARFSDGSLRDAESLLDQILCFTKDRITEEIVDQTLGLIPEELFFSLDTAVQKQDLFVAFEIVQKLISSGKNLSHFCLQLSEHFRLLLFLKLGKTLDGYREEDIKRYESSLSIYTEEQLFKIYSLIAKNSSFKLFPRLEIESLLIQIIQSVFSYPLTTLVQRLEDLEVRLSSNTSPEGEKNSILVKVPFDLSISKEASLTTTLKDEIKEKIKEPSLSRSHYDTLLQFAAVELKGNLIKEN